MQTGKIVFKSAWVVLFVLGSILGSGCNQPSDAPKESKNAVISNASGGSVSGSSITSVSAPSETILLNSTLFSINQSFNSLPQYLLSPDDIALLKSEAGLSDAELASLGLFVKN